MQCESTLATYGDDCGRIAMDTVSDCINADTGPAAEIVEDAAPHRVAEHDDQMMRGRFFRDG